MIQTFWQAFRFGIVGLVNTAVGLLAIYSTMYLLNTGPLSANAIGYALGMAVSFSLNRMWTFNNQQPIRTLVARYLAAGLFSYLINFCVVYIAYEIYALGKYTSQIFGVAAYTLCMFVICKMFVFNASVPDNCEERNDKTFYG